MHEVALGILCSLFKKIDFGFYHEECERGHKVAVYQITHLLPVARNLHIQFSDFLIWFQNTMREIQHEFWKRKGQSAFQRPCQTIYETNTTTYCQNSREYIWWQQILWCKCNISMVYLGSNQMQRLELSALRKKNLRKKCGII